MTPIISMHIPKTGGTSMLKAMRRRFNDDEFVRLSVQHTEKELRRLKKPFKIVHGHLRYGFHQHIPGPVDYVTIVRHPVDRVMSVYSYNRHLRDRDNYAKDHDFEEWYTRYAGSTANTQAQMISPNYTDIHELLHNAKTNFKLIGVTDRFPQFMEAFSEMVGRTHKVYQLNKTPKTACPIEDIVLGNNQDDLTLYEFVRRNMAP